MAAAQVIAVSTELNTAAEKKVSLSSLRPTYDVQMGTFPPERTMTVSELLRPAILKVSDQHLGLQNSYVAKLYEMRENIIPDVVTNNGDKVDLQALASKHIFFTIEALCLIDQSNWLQAKNGTKEVSTEGNHDQKFILATEKARQAGINIFPGIRIRHPKQRDIVEVHGHHFDSPTMVLLPMRIAASIYDDMVSRGEDGAAAAKIVTKLLLDGLGYEEAYKNASHKYDANLDIGHLHLLKLLKLQYRRELSLQNVKKDVKNFAKNSVISSLLWAHRTGRLETFITKTLLPAFRRAADVATEQLGGEKKLDASRHGLQGMFRRVAVQMLPVLENDPAVSLLNDLSLDKLRPLNRAKTSGATESGAKAAEINVYGCWIDGRSTFGATYADGTTFSLDWMKVREAIKHDKGLPDVIPSGNELVAKHLKAYGGFHPKTLQQFALFHELRGVLSDEETRSHAKLPELKAMPTLTITATGKVDIVTPDQRPLAVVPMPNANDIVRPAELVERLSAIDPRTGTDLQERILGFPSLQAVFGVPQTIIPERSGLVFELPVPRLPVFVAQGGPRPAFAASAPDLR